MSKDVKAIENMRDYVGQLRRHTEGRRAVHIKLSVLERHFREEHYRLFCAATLRVLVTKFGATIFALPNADLVVVTRDAAVDNIDPPITLIRRKFRESAVIASIDPVQGLSDDFVTWFDLEHQYVDFRHYIDALANRLLHDPHAPAPQEIPQISNLASVAADTPAPDVPLKGVLLKIDRPDNIVVPVAPKRAVRMVPISHEAEEVDLRMLDPELLLVLLKGLQGVDVAGLLRKQGVMAIIGDEAPMPVFMHKYIPRQLLLQTLLKGLVVTDNRWLSGYLEDLVVQRVLMSAPGMDNEKSLASSLRVTVASVLGDAFETFDQSLGVRSRAKVILEFGLLDMMADPGAYDKAVSRAINKGYRIMLADIEPQSFVRLDDSQMQCAFIKMRKPVGPTSAWLDKSMERLLQHKIEHMGIARVILDGCETPEDIKLGQSLGVTLFQGDAADPQSLA